jgi:hypothetical protein
VSENWPFNTGPVHVLLPWYVPEILVFVTPRASPEIETAQVGRPEIPPTGTMIWKVRMSPTSAPEKVPLKTTDPDGVLAVTDPEGVVPVCVRTQVMLPGPVESEAVPEYVPLSVTLGPIGPVGVPPHPAATAASPTIKEKTNILIFTKHLFLKLRFLYYDTFTF